jgi:endoglycosylceramidase
MLPAALPQTPKLPFGKFKQWITDADGRVIIVHGVNMINKLPPYTLSSTGFGVADAQLLASAGINAVRVGVIYSAVEPAPGVYDDAYLADIAGTIDILAAHGILSLIDFHQDGWGPSFICEGFPEWATLTTAKDPVVEYPIRPVDSFPKLLLSDAAKAAFGNFWRNTPGPGGVPLQERFAAAWAYTVRFLNARNTPGILGWELLNEPWPGNVVDPVEAQALLTAFTQRIVDAIRNDAKDTDHMIWYEPWVMFDAGDPTNIGTIHDPTGRIGFAFHNYRKIDDDYGMVWNKALDHYQKSGNPLLATEFGAEQRDVPGQALILEKQMASADDSMMPVIYWTYWNRTPYQIVGETGPVSAPGMGIVYDPTQPLTAGNVWQEGLQALSRVYPQLIAGEPLSWTFNPYDRRFSFVYIATPQGITEIFVPSSHYIHPPTVTIAGEVAKWDLTDQVLRIWAGPKPTTVKVTIT